MIKRNKVQRHEAINNTVNALFTSLKRTGKFFRDISMTISNGERREMMIAKYHLARKFLRKLFDWNSTEKKKYLTSSGEYRGLQAVSEGGNLPLHHFEVIWCGDLAGNSMLVSTSLPSKKLRAWAKELSKLDGRDSMLATWKKNFPWQYERATTALHEADSKKTYHQALSVVRDKSTLVRVGGNIPPDGVRYIPCEPGINCEILVAFILAAYGSCLLGWLHGLVPDSNSNLTAEIPPTVGELNAVALALVSAQLEPGVIWDCESYDGTLCQLNVPSGLRQVLGRPSIPLNATLNRDFWHLIGTLCPSVGESVWAIGISRDKGTRFGFLTPECPSRMVFSLLQTGVSPMVRRIVAIKHRDNTESNASVFLGLSEECRKASYQGLKSNEHGELAAELFEGLNKLVSIQARTRNTEKLRTFGLEYVGWKMSDKLRSIGVQKDTTRLETSVMQILGALKEGLIPDSNTRRAFRRYFLGIHNGNPLE